MELDTGLQHGLLAISLVAGRMWRQAMRQAAGAVDVDDQRGLQVPVTQPVTRVIETCNAVACRNQPIERLGCTRVQSDILRDVKYIVFQLRTAACLPGMEPPQRAQAVGQLPRRRQQPRHGHVLDNVLQGRLEGVQATQHQAVNVGA